MGKCHIVITKYTKENLLIINVKGKECILTRLKYSNNKIYKGTFKNDKPDGPGILQHSNGSIVKGVWKAGKMEKQENH